MGKAKNFVSQVLQGVHLSYAIACADNVHIPFAPKPLRATNDHLSAADKQAKLQERDRRFRGGLEIHGDQACSFLSLQFPLHLLPEIGIIYALTPRSIPFLTARIEKNEIGL